MIVGGPEGIFFPVADRPYILEETAAYAVVYKPPRWHSAPLERDGDLAAPTLLRWYAALNPGVLEVRGRKAHEGGLLHRLDFETEGLVLFAKTQSAMDALARQQREGLFVKEYAAFSRGNRETLPGFPPPFVPGPPPFTLQSAFRAFGRGRREVRPVVLQDGGKVKKKIALDQGEPYKTEVLEMSCRDGLEYFRLRLNRGFRHQIRCHLAWLGYAILNDKTYGGCFFDGRALALRAQTISFYDPESLAPRNYRLPLTGESGGKVYDAEGGALLMASGKPILP
jgi:23S rRNA pseudouridine1911/1915/1917 synthase